MCLEPRAGRVIAFSFLPILLVEKGETGGRFN